MNKVNKLIQKYCPDGVEYIALGNVCRFVSGFAFKASAFASGGEPICKTTNIQNNEIVFWEMDRFNQDDYSENLDKYIIQPQDVVIGMSGTIKVGINRTNNRCYLNQRVGKFLPHKEVLNNKFLYYILCNSVPSLEERVSGGSVKNLSNKDILNLSIPIPPLAVQKEIVRILDKFTELEAELEAELEKEQEARKKQYEWYRGSLFDQIASQSPSVTINDICKNVVSGGTPTASKNEYYNGNIPWLRTQEVNWNEITDTDVKITQSGYDNSSAKWIPANCVIVAMYGATAGKAAINKIPLTTNQACCNLEINESLALYRYVYHWICNEYQRIKALGQGSQNNINAGTIKNYSIPLPSLDEQRRIVAILEQFDTLCNDITTGLPAEIAARRKQYEYYRDKLLSFEEVA